MMRKWFINWVGSRGLLKRLHNKPPDTFHACKYKGLKYMAVMLNTVRGAGGSTVAATGHKQDNHSGPLGVQSVALAGRILRTVVQC